jgi:hypothetical protein
MRVLLAYSQADATAATTLYLGLSHEDDLAVTGHTLGTGGTHTETLSTLIEGHDAVVQLISVRFLKSLGCMRELIGLIKDDTQRSMYRECTVPVIISDPADDIDLSDTPGQLRLVDFWTDEAKKLEDGLSSRSHVGAALDELRDDLVIIRDVAEQVMRFMRTITDNIYATFYSGEPDVSLQAILSHLRQIEPLPTESQQSPSRATRLLHPFNHLSNADNDRSPERNFDGRQRPTAIDHEALRKLRDGISVASENDPNKPEFPSFSPRFPATPTERIAIPQLGRTIMIKDESRNLTGSHKDRMAWEIIVHYKKIIQDLLEPASSRPTIPRASIISNGSAALAIQVMLRCYGLPELKVLVDLQTDKQIVQKLRKAGCEVFIHDLSERELDSKDVLEITENEDGLDFTSRNLVDPNRRTYYDWLAYEILNCAAMHIFIPVGTGDLFVNVLTVLRDELTGVTKDRRLTGGSPTIEGLELYGATSEDWKTKMDKLYAAHRPTLVEARRLVAEMREAGHCGERSEVYDVGEIVVPDALEAARTKKIQCDESGIAGLALLLELSKREEFPADEEILVVNTGWLALP